MNGQQLRAARKRKGGNQERVALKPRIVEALPWVALKFPDLDWRWLTDAAKVNNLQNRLGFVWE